MNQIIKILKSKGIEIAASFIPGGNLVQSALKSIATSLIGDENASEDLVKTAIENANSDQIKDLKSDLEKLGIELSISQEKSIQEQEKTKQEEARVSQEELITKRRAFDFIQHITQKRPVLTIAIYSLLFYAVLIGILFYAKKYMQDADAIEHSIISLCVIYITFPIAIIYQPMYKIVDGLADSIVHLIKAPIRFLR